MRMKWHMLATEALFERFGTSFDGLSSEQAGERLLRHGPNALPEADGLRLWRLVLDQVASPLIYVLFIAAGIAVWVGEYIDASVICSIVILNGIIGFTQEFKAERSVSGLKSLLSPRATVMRDAREREVPVEDLVPGDLVVLASGAVVPADLRLIRATELRADESALTGESVPAAKTAAPLADPFLPAVDQSNMAFKGTAIVHGRGMGLAVATGEATWLGSIARKMRSVGRVKPPITVRFERFARQLSLAVVIAAAALFGVGIMVGESVKDMFLMSVAAFVAAVPEGLPIVVTIAMAVGVHRMARHNAVIRKLPAVETLGSTTVICSDKTGTLTLNEMTVRTLADGEACYALTGQGAAPEGDILCDGRPCAITQAPRLRDMLVAGVLCNESRITEEDGIFLFEGDPTENALLTAALKGGLNPAATRVAHRQLALLPFESERGFMASLSAVDGRGVALLKGAPERLLEACASDWAGTPLNAANVRDTASAMAREGLRVLLLARKDFPDGKRDLHEEDVRSGLTFLGLMGLLDPPRPEAARAVAGCRRAGIRLKMLTGDHPETAVAVASMIGLAHAGDVALTGRELERLDGRDFDEAVLRHRVFARVMPSQKLAIVESLKRQGQVVAVTGDGVNDAPALKAAHIGVAMGRKGTDVAREASDMVLTDDSINSVYHAVQEGRIMFDNLRKAVFFLLPTGLAELLSIMAAMVMGLPLPFVPTQILWINLVTNGLQDVALALEPGEPDVLDRRPRPLDEGILNKALLWRTIIVGVTIAAGVVWYFQWLYRSGQEIEVCRTGAVTAMVFFQFFQVLNCRSEKRSIFLLNPFSNMFLLASMVAAALAQVAVVQWPGFQWIFRTTPLTWRQWAACVGLAVSVVVVVEAGKLMSNLAGGRLRRGA
ncbi:ATPase, P-type (transporting), HAD superfamily, subfamily IC [Solidesulfovibrio fructosivorans JJ]]|uniref:ATPase, P-type (Transporting), HAD superfamily, subfamily IC n=1 Tax=Solidesulfovibrio fructosivorans JJ] TaxID=596151 RepID=E1JSX0_SOLFR|nr:HAD-IC family P-type ATPase [Solidesulfovibrio fructosivorans]EFL52603.1 ATPase, P-type (transporting), HAD superfamily, subfamily IC [Solidesulfovibrio fructosivorans JJ]]